MTELNTYGPTDLEAVLAKLPKFDQSFGRDLVLKSKKYKMTDKQLWWIDRLTKKAKAELVVEQPVENVGQMKGLYELFAKASKHLKYPKIGLEVDGHPVALVVSGPNSKNPGIVNVTDGKPFGHNKWYGRVTEAGAWETCKTDYPELPVVRKLLTEMSENPAKVASEYGRLTGYCCFCRSKLTDEKSTAVGYGPVCAERYGLPYGSKITQLLKAAQEELA